MRIIFLVTIMISIVRICFGQDDSIRTEIINLTDSKSMLIAKGRILLLDKFLKGDLGNVSGLDNYLTNELSDKDYLSLYPIEHWLIEYWTKDYSNLLQNVMLYDSMKATMLHKVQPPTDNLYMKLREKSKDSKQSIVNELNNASISAQQKEFLILFFYSCLYTKDSPGISQDTINYLADKYIQNYPDNEFVGFTRKYLRHKLVPSKWGFTFEFFSGYGIFSGNLKNNFTNNVPFGVAFDVYYKKFALYLRDYIGFSYTSHDFTGKSEVWPKNSQVRVFLPEASLGYVVQDSKHFKLAPFIGISSTDITPTDYDLKDKPNLKDYELTFTTTYSIGFNVDFKFGKPQEGRIYNGPEQSYWFVRIRYAYNFPQFSKSYPGFDGNMQYITVGIGGFVRKLKRDY